MRDDRLFFLTLLASVGLHVALAYSMAADDEAPAPLPVDQGRVTVRLMAAQVPAATPPKIEVEADAPLRRTEPVRMPRPQVQQVAPAEITPDRSLSAPREPPPEEAIETEVEAPPLPRELAAVQLPPIPVRPVEAAETLDSEEEAAADVLPRPISNPLPPYPAEALAARVTGTVELLVRIAADGKPSHVSVHRSSGTQSLDESATRTVRDRWRFTPARRGNVAVSQTVIVPVRFRIGR